MTLKRIPAIKNTEIYVLHLLKSLFVLYPIKPNTAKINAEITNQKYI